MKNLYCNKKYIFLPLRRLCYRTSQRTSIEVLKTTCLRLFKEAQPEKEPIKNDPE